MPRRAHSHRDKQREIPDSVLRKMQRNVGIDTPPIPGELGGPELIVPSDVAQVDRARSFASKIAIDTVLADRGKIRGAYGLPDMLFDNDGVLMRTFQIWGEPGVLQRDAGAERAYKGRSWFGDQRSQIAAALCLDKLEMRPTKLATLARHTFTAASSVVAALGRHRELTEQYATGDEYNTVAYLLDRNSLTEVKDPEVSIRGAEFRTRAGEIFADRISDVAPKDQRRLLSVYERVFDLWTGFTAYSTAESARRSFPEGSYQRNIELIDWQLLMAEQEKRGILPDDAIGHVTSTLRSACAEQGLDYHTLNSMAARREEAAMGVSSSVAWAHESR